VLRAENGTRKVSVPRLRPKPTKWSASDRAFVLDWAGLLCPAVIADRIGKTEGQVLAMIARNSKQEG